jgi:hypothetical protein
MNILSHEILYTNDIRTQNFVNKMSRFYAKVWRSAVLVTTSITKEISCVWKPHHFSLSSNILPWLATSYHFPSPIQTFTIQKIHYEDTYHLPIQTANHFIHRLLLPRTFVSQITITLCKKKLKWHFLLPEHTRYNWEHKITHWYSSFSFTC